MGKYFFGNREVVRLNRLVLLVLAAIARVNEEGLEDVRSLLRLRVCGHSTK